MRMSIHKSENFSINSIHKEVDHGAVFIAYKYIISIPIFPPVQRFSKLYLIKSFENKSMYCTGSNIINLLLGLWGLPFGPYYMLSAIRMNSKGGVDFTEDVLHNLKEEDLKNGFVDLAKPYRIFTHPGKSSLQSFTKCFYKIEEQLVLSHRPVIGYFIDTEKDERPYYIIAFNQDINQEIIDTIKAEIYKKFVKTMKVEIISLSNGEFIHTERLLNEGIEISK
ncbi:MAG: hypothetical protein HOG05_05705 [Bacteroidetes bacterium]|nr:hypothetical protein [Bacteroidota bacterium]